MLLKEKYPQSRTQFDVKLNTNIKFDELTAGSMKQVWWRCNKAKDHVWQSSINQRTSGKKLRGCPFCTGKRVAKSNSLATTHPKIVVQWYHKKNLPLTPNDVTAGSNKKIWWKCNKGSNHIWQASPKQRTKKSNSCPVCKSLGYLYPDMLLEWHPIKNGSLTPFNISYSAHTKVWWKCPRGPDHIWQASPNTRISTKPGCPICPGYKVVNSNSLATTHPEIAAQWHYAKNKPLSPNDVHKGSHKKVWWKCDKGEDHIWKAVIKSRSNGVGCPICSGRKIAKSNSLATKKPKIARLWHPSKNYNLTPYDVTPYSSKLIWWKCPRGEDHEWKATVANVVNGSTCPVCMNRKITPTNNIFALFPHLKREWDFAKNEGINPVKTSAGSKEKVWWICKKDTEHRWIATIRDRTVKNSSCPFCAIKLNVSETKMFEIIKEIFPKEEVLYRYKPKWLQRMELDVFVPRLRLAFEYQGVQHFKPIDLFGGEKTYIEQVKRDKIKNKICNSKNIVLIYVYYDETLSKNLIRGRIIDAGIYLA